MSPARLYSSYLAVNCDRQIIEIRVKQGFKSSEHH